MKLANFKLIFIITGQTVITAVRNTGRLTVLFFQGFFSIFTPPFRFWKIIEQIYFIGAKSLFVVSLAAMFTGMVLGVQSYYTLVKFGAEGMLGTAVALSIIRELGPVLTGIMITGMAGSAITAEIGVMRISEQIDALISMDINPIDFLISSRIAASLICFPLLTAIFDVIGIFCGYMTGSLLLGIDTGSYFARIISDVVMSDIIEGFIKSVVFGALVAAVCCYYGYYAHKRKEGFGAKGVSFATKSAVVTSSIVILAADYILTSVLL
jgi:phospholipid/cholesterol/gamma-HCH transport system permease protein